MSLFSFWRPWTKSNDNAATADLDDRRTARRYDENRPVTIVRDLCLHAQSFIVNISLTGAAIRVYSGWYVPETVDWVTKLKSGDDIWLSDLLTEPVFCWVVALEDGVLRVRFSLTEAARSQLRQLIATS
jgi:hypothetical protein